MANARTLLGASLLCGLCFCLVNAQHYYGSAGPIQLNVDSTKVLIKFDPDLPVLNQGEVINSIPRISAVIEDESVIDTFIVCSLEISSNYYQFLDSLQTINGILFSEPYYVLGDGTPVLVGRTVCIGFEGWVSVSQIDSIASALGIIIDTAILSNVYIMKNALTSGLRVLELANTLYDLPHIGFSHPDFGLRPSLTSYKVFDHYHSYQMHLKKVIGEFNVASAWDFAGTTDSVVVAVLDDGVTTHEDFPLTRLLQGHDFVDDDKGAHPILNDAHGMGVTGIIAASHTIDSLAGLNQNTGILSMDAAVKILPIRLFSNNQGLSVSKMAAGISYAWKNGAQVLSNSWGYRDSLDRPAISVAVDSAYQFGRNGLGCPIIFSSGNEAEDQPGIVAFPAKLPACLAVGAIDLDDVHWVYSQYGPELDVVAPSGGTCLGGDVWSLDQMANGGYNPNLSIACLDVSVYWQCPTTAQNDTDYDCNFGGTSAATPIVSGVAAILISKDSTLTVQDIYEIIENSALRDLFWGSLDDTTEDVQIQYGYGRVDAFRAILSISRGDLNNDGTIGNILDLTFLVDRIYRGGPYPFPSPLMGDCNCDGAANNVVDLTYLVNAVWRGGPPPVNPCFEF
jgi:subtilisin family serine protease